MTFCPVETPFTAGRQRRVGAHHQHGHTFIHARLPSVGAGAGAGEGTGVGAAETRSWESTAIGRHGYTRSDVEFEYAYTAGCR